MKVITINPCGVLCQEINQWIGAPCCENTPLFTLNFPQWILRFIHKKQHILRETPSRSEFLRQIIIKYLSYLKDEFKDYKCEKCQRRSKRCIHRPEISPSRSEFIRHAFMWWYYNREINKTKEGMSKNGLPIINGKEVEIIMRLD